MFSADLSKLLCNVLRDELADRRRVRRGTLRGEPAGRERAIDVVHNFEREKTAS